MIANVAVHSETLFSLENQPTDASVCDSPARRRGGERVGIYERKTAVIAGYKKGWKRRGERGRKRVAPAREI